MPIIKSISNFTAFKCDLGRDHHCNTPLSPNAGIQASVPDLASIISDPRSVLYSTDNIEKMIQSLEAVQASSLQAQPEMPEEPKFARKNQSSQTE